MPTVASPDTALLEGRVNTSALLGTYSILSRPREINVSKAPCPRIFEPRTSCMKVKGLLQYSIVLPHNAPDSN